MILLGNAEKWKVEWECKDKIPTITCDDKLPFITTQFFDKYVITHSKLIINFILVVITKLNQSMVQLRFNLNEYISHPT